MWETLAFSVIGTGLFALAGVALVYLMAMLGKGQRIRVSTGRATGDSASGRPRTRRRPRR